MLLIRWAGTVDDSTCPYHTLFINARTLSGRFVRVAYGSRPKHGGAGAPV